jgi:hypothetical protein
VDAGVTEHGDPRLQKVETHRVYWGGSDGGGGFNTSEISGGAGSCARSHINIKYTCHAIG